MSYTDDYVKPVPFAQPTTALGAGLQNLTMALFGGPTRTKRLADEALEASRLADAAKAQAETERLIAEGRGADDLAGLIAGVPGLQAMQHIGGAGRMDPGEITADNIGDAMGNEISGARAGRALIDLPGLLASAAVRGGKDTMGSVADLFQFVTANNPAAGDNAVVRAMAGAGNALGVNEAVSLPGQDRVRAANAINDRNQAVAVEQAKPLTYDQVRGQSLADFLAGADRRDVGTIVGAYDKPDFQPFERPDGTTALFDPKAPQPVAIPLPVRKQTPDGGTDFFPDVMKRLVGTSTDDGLTAARKTRESEAASLGLTTQELDFVERVEAAIRAAGDPDDAGLAPETKAAYTALVARMRPLAAPAAVAGRALPPGFRPLPAGQ